MNAFGGWERACPKECTWYARSEMLRVLSWSLFVCGAWMACAGERVFDFNQYPFGQTPAGFQSLLTGQGKPGEWKVIAEPVEPGAEASTNRVLAQLSQDGTDERFPLLVLDEEQYGDFTLTTRFKLMQGLFEQMAGFAFRLQDTNNYYYVRASALGSNFRFFKLVDGQRLSTVGPTIEVARGVWHDLKIECKGNHIVCQLDGKDVMPALTDNTFLTGRIAFWTKSDSVSCFGETRITYTPHEILAEILVREALHRYPRLVGLRLYLTAKRRGESDRQHSQRRDRHLRWSRGSRRDQTRRDLLRKRKALCPGHSASARQKWGSRSSRSGHFGVISRTD